MHRSVDVVFIGPKVYLVLSAVGNSLRSLQDCEPPPQVIPNHLTPS